jgi:hypothetical protein
MPWTSVSRWGTARHPLDEIRADAVVVQR